METKPTYETKALTMRQTLTPNVWEMIMAIGQATADSKQFNMYHPEEAAIKMLVAYEHGIPLTSALSTVYVIDNKPVFAPVLMWAKILASPDFDSYEEKRLEKPDGSFAGWEMTLRRKNGHQATRRFTMDQARAITVNASGKKLADKDNWRNYPEDVCYWRVMERCAKVVFADVIAGIYSADELGADITPEGNVIDADPWSVVVPEPEQPPKVDFDYLLEHWTADQIIEANGGKVPGKDDLAALAVELERLDAEKLGGVF